MRGSIPWRHVSGTQVLLNAVVRSGSPFQMISRRPHRSIHEGETIPYRAIFYAHYHLLGNVMQEQPFGLAIMLSLLMDLNATIFRQESDISVLGSDTSMLRVDCQSNDVFEPVINATSGLDGS